MHRCRAEGCQKVVDDSLLMCKPHWFAAPEELRLAVWREYRAREGSAAHHHACYKLTQAIAVKEGRITQETADGRIEKHKRLLRLEDP